MIATGTTEAKVSPYFPADCTGSRCTDCNLDQSRRTLLPSQSNAPVLFYDSRNTKNASAVCFSTRRVVAQPGYTLTNPEIECYAPRIALRCHSFSGRQIFNMYHRRMSRLSIRRIQSSPQSCARERGSQFAQMAINNQFGSSGSLDPLSNPPHVTVHSDPKFSYNL